jgi:hypothetical protein
MAFRITYQGAVIEADTAADVRELVLLFSTPVDASRLLTSGDPPAVDVSAPGRGRRRTGTRRRPRVGGGMRKAPGPRQTPPMPGRAAARPRRKPLGADELDFRSDVLQVVRRGVSKPSDITEACGKTTFVTRGALKALVADGQLRVEGKTMSRRYYLAEAPRGAKEGLR